MCSIRPADLERRQPFTCLASGDFAEGQACLLCTYSKPRLCALCLTFVFSLLLLRCRALVSGNVLNEMCVWWFKVMLQERPVSSAGKMEREVMTGSSAMLQCLMSLQVGGRRSASCGCRDNHTRLSGSVLSCLSSTHSPSQPTSHSTPAKDTSLCSAAV